MTIYFISGLGADERAFANLRLPETVTIRHVKWIMPERNETLERYAGRLCVQVNTNEPFILIGLSFGGIVAIEMAEFIHPRKIILLSSIGCRKELPLRFRIAGYMGLDRLIPSFSYRRTNFFVYRLFGTHSKGEQQMMKQIIKDSSATFVKWAIHAMLNWKRKTRKAGIVHIHGTDDLLLPVRHTKPDFRIRGGGHMMVYNRAEEVSRLIIQIIDQEKG